MGAMAAGIFTGCERPLSNGSGAGWLDLRSTASEGDGAAACHAQFQKPIGCGTDRDHGTGV